MSRELERLDGAFSIDSPSPHSRWRQLALQGGLRSDIASGLSGFCATLKAAGIACRHSWSYTAISGDGFVGTAATAPMAGRQG